MQRCFDADERVQVNAHPSTINNQVERHLQLVSYQRTKIEQIMESNSSLIISTRANNSLSDKLRGRSNITRVPTYYYTWCNGQGTPTIRSVGRISFGTPRKGLVCLTRPPLPTLDRRIHEHVVMPTSSSGHGKPRMKAEERGRAARRWCNPPLRAGTAMYTRWYLEVAHSDPKL